jgi:hypothetical protein
MIHMVCTTPARKDHRGRLELLLAHRAHQARLPVDRVRLSIRDGGLEAGIVRRLAVARLRPQVGRVAVDLLHVLLACRERRGAGCLDGSQRGVTSGGGGGRGGVRRGRSV